MSIYEEQYYIVSKQYDENTLYLRALDRTENRDYDFEKLRFGEEPLFFENAYKDEDKAAGLIRPLKKAHMNSTYLIVDDSIKGDLEGYDISGFQFYPAVIIDDDGNYHENYWFFNIYNEYDFLDCEGSEIKNYKPGAKRNKVVKYKLDDEKLQAVSEESRLIFMMPNTDQRTTYVHQKVVDVFEKHGVDNINFLRMSEWYRGKQFRR
jgi:hypothetical protein